MLEQCNPKTKDCCDLERPLDLDKLPKPEKVPFEQVQALKEKIKQAHKLFNKVYLTSTDSSLSKVIVNLYVDCGYTKPNLLKKLGNIKKHKPEQTVITATITLHIWNEEKKQYYKTEMVHSSKFLEHPISEHPQLFLGLSHELEPKSFYHYVITCETETSELITTPINSFKAPIVTNNEPFFFAASADLHGGYKAWFRKGKAWCIKPKRNKWLSKVAQAIKSREVEQTLGERYNFFAVAGDLTDNASYDEYWADLFESASPVLAQHVLIPTIGNHDYYAAGIWRGSWKGLLKRNCKYYHSFIQVPETNGEYGHYFSLDLGNVHLVFLDTNTREGHMGRAQIDCNSPQWKWLEQDLANWRRNLHENNGSKFCLIFLHSAIFSVGYFGKKKNNADYHCQQYLMPLIKKYGVNLCIFGHDHIYQRSKWLDTTYLCLGLNGGIKINYSKRHLRKASYTIAAIFKGQKARGYSVIYVPPREDYINGEDFRQKLAKYEKIMLEQPIEQFVAIEKDRAEQLNNNKEAKRKYIQENILIHLSEKMWIRYYTHEGKLLDSFFIAPNIEGYDEQGKSDYEIVCPEKHVGYWK